MELSTLINDLFESIQSGAASRVQEIMASHPQLANKENREGLTPLGYAAHFGNAEAVRILLSHQADVNAVSHSIISFIPSNTALHASLAGSRNMDVIKLLLSRQAQTNIYDSNGHTCMHTAAFHDDNLDIIRLLIEHGADVNAALDGGDTPLALAVQQGNDQVAELLRQHGARI